MTGPMDYPDPRYLGEGGEVSATIRRATGPPDLVRAGGVPVHYLATGGTTDGLFGLYRWQLGPEPGGAWPHFHRTISESFYILDGAVEIHDGTGWVDAGPHEYVYVPAGGIHGFRNTSGAPASMLILFAPGAPREAYFEGLADLADMTDQERTDFFHRHDNVYLDG